MWRPDERQRCRDFTDLAWYSFIHLCGNKAAQKLEQVKVTALKVDNQLLFVFYCWELMTLRELRANLGLWPSCCSCCWYLQLTTVWSTVLTNIISPSANYSYCSYPVQLLATLNEAEWSLTWEVAKTLVAPTELAGCRLFDLTLRWNEVDVGKYCNCSSVLVFTAGIGYQLERQQLRLDIYACGEWK